jgi:ectoine hydroxylase-related dioxygenase (phytanoyl-CoA dioxygenase family)
MTDQLQRARRLGWHASVPPNGHGGRAVAAPGTSNTNPLGLATPDTAIETSPEHRNLTAGDPSVVGWTRAYDDPNVVALRDKLNAHNGIKGLQVVAPDELARASELFHRDGFVVVRDVLPPDRLERVSAAVDRAIDALVAVDPTFEMGGGAGGLPHRYSFGASSATRHLMHVREWTELIDLPTTTPLLEAIFGSPNFLCIGGGGDIAMPGSIEYQGLHSDNLWTELHDPAGGLTMRDMPVPAVTINFLICDVTRENGPIRQIPGSQRFRAPIPSLADEPEWMKLSTVCPVPAGSAIFRDNRAWHGGTPNLSLEPRPMPNIEYFAPWFRSEAIMRSMPYDEWKQLSPHARRICRYIMVEEGKPVIGAGHVHPRKADREAHKEAELQALGPDAAAEWRDRL